jgi:S-adenosylmethionine-dependent methyltransferase
VPDEPRDRPAHRHAATGATGAASAVTTAGHSLRTQGVWDTVRDLVDQRQADLGRPLHVLDLGGGTGGLAVPLAELGHHVTVVDPSPNALAALEQRAADAGVADRISGRQGDADSIGDLGLDPAGSAGSTGSAGSAGSGGSGSEGSGGGQAATAYDLVCCHGVLEVVDDPAAALRGITGVLAPKGHLSLLVAGRLAVVLAKALAGEVEQATAALTSADGRWGRSDPLPRRFDVAGLTALLDETAFTTLQVQGVRVFADLVPSSALDSAADRAALATLERAVATHPHYAEVLGRLGAGLHAIAQRG